MTSTVPDPRRWRALLVTLAGGFMVLLDVTIVTIAVPSIQRGLDASAAGVQWVVSGYPLMFGLALVAGGRLGDAFGRRRMYLIALTGFIVTSALCGAAPTLEFLVVARLLQGIVAGAITPQNAGLIQDMFQGAERGKAFGMLGATIGLSTAVGPVVGGGILDAFGEPDGWRWVFFVNVPVGLVTLLLAARLVPRVDRRAGRSDIDVLGMVLLGIAVLCLLFPVVQSESGGLRRFWWLMPLSVPIGLLFLRWERRRVARGRAPLLDIRLFTEVRGYPSGCLVASVYFAGFSGIWLTFALFFQTGLGLSPLASGLAVAPFSIGSAISAVIAGRLVGRFGRRLTVFGLITVAIGLGVVAVIVPLVPSDRTAVAILLPMLVAGIGGGAVISPNNTMTLSNVPTRMAGVAAGVIQTGQRMGAAIGTALLAAVFHAVAGGRNFATGMSLSLVFAVVLILVAMSLAVWELRTASASDLVGKFPGKSL